jgi:ABC-type transport system involved in multi-copper enzyme maturation permease subunit
MFHKVEIAVEWVSVPALLIGSIFSYFATSYEPLLIFAICLGGAILAGRALHCKQYFLAAGFVATVVASSPLALASMIFLLMGLACIGVSATVFATFRPRPEPVA